MTGVSVPGGTRCLRTCRLSLVSSCSESLCERAGGPVGQAYNDRLCGPLALNAGLPRMCTCICWWSCTVSRAGWLL
jgi:hypothetical protein